MTQSDIIDALAGLAPGSPLTVIRDRKPVTREYAQMSYRALFQPAETDVVSIMERFALAVFIAGLHAEGETAALYAAGLARTAPPGDFIRAVHAEILNGRARGPYGAFPMGPLSKEDVSGPFFTVTEKDVLGPRLAAAFQHVHMLIFHPRDANPEALQALLDAGWSNTGIVTISQLTAFLAFQIRAAVGLRILARSAP
jgi:CMD domain protein